MSSVDSIVEIRLLRERRSTIRLIVDILNVALEGATKTEIVYKANLNFKEVHKFLEFLIKKGLLSVSSNKRKKYQTTERGKEFIRRYKRTVELIT